MHPTGWVHNASAGKINFFSFRSLFFLGKRALLLLWLGGGGGREREREIYGGGGEGEVLWWSGSLACLERPPLFLSYSKVHVRLRGEKKMKQVVVGMKIQSNLDNWEGGGGSKKKIWPNIFFLHFRW